MTSHVQRMDLQKYSEGRALLGRAFHHYPLMEYAIGNSKRRLRATTSLYGGILKDALRFGEVWTTTELAGIACWLSPGTGPMGLFRQLWAGMAAAPFRFGWTGIRRLIAYDELAISLHHQFAPEPHWYLAVIGVDADRQGQGVGSTLIASHTDRADDEGMACYLETQYERNAKLYERLGFEICWYGTPEGHPIPTWAMRREPR